MHEIAVSSVVRRVTMVAVGCYTVKGADDTVKAYRERLKRKMWTATERREECFRNGTDVYMTESAWRAIK